MGQFKDVFFREIRRMGNRPAYLVGMILVPMAVVFFFLSLLSPGLPERIPCAMVDLDQSALSREVRRTLNSSQMVDATHDAESYSQALDMVRRGEVFGFFVIPAEFERDAIGGRTPTLEYYSNMTYFVPGTLSFKGFKTVAITTSGGLTKATLVSLGIGEQLQSALLQPVIIDINPLNNPWMNYSYYMAPSFTMATFVLMMMIMSVMSITSEIKDGTSVEWMRTAGGSMSRALAGKMLPHTIVYIVMAMFILWMFFCWQHFPLNGPLGWIILSSVLLVVASQCFALMISSILPNPRLAFSVVGLFGVLSYSFTGFSMPEQSMYGAVAVFSWLAPVRYWYLIYIETALNGYDIYYCRWYFVALMAFVALPAFFLRKLKKAMLNPVYVS